MAMARAAPSVGSVPAHSSSKSTRECWRCLVQNPDTMLVIWEEKVLRICSILCSSPMSANTSSKTASSELSSGRNMKAGLSHQGKKAHGFQGNSFTAGVGAGDDQQVEVFAQPDGDGNDLLRIQQGMAAFLDVDASVLSLNIGTGWPFICRASRALAKMKSRAGQKLHDPWVSSSV